MVGQTQPCPPSQSQSLLTDAEASLRLGSRRKLMYSNGRKTSAINQGALEDGSPPETDVNQGESLKNRKFPKRTRNRSSYIICMMWYNICLNLKSCVLYSQKKKKLAIRIITEIKSGKGKKEVLCQRCQTYRRLRKSTLRLHPAAQSVSQFLWIHRRFVTFLFFSFL